MRQLLFLTVNFLLFVLAGFLLLVSAMTIGMALSHATFGLVFLNFIATLLVTFILIVMAVAHLSDVLPALIIREEDASVVKSEKEKLPVFDAYYVIRLMIPVHATITVLLFKPIVSEAGFLVPLWIALVWTKLAATLLLLALVHRRRSELDAPFLLAGTATSALVFAAAWFHAPALYGWDLQPGGWYGILVTALPLLLFLNILLRRYPPFFAGHRQLRRGFVMCLFLIVAAVTGQIVAAEDGNDPAGTDFGNRLDAALDTGATEIHFAELTDFEWDRVEIYFSGWGAEDHFSPVARKGIDLITRSDSRITWYEGWHFLVFIDDERVVYHEIIGGKIARFPYSHYESMPIELSYDEANFIVRYATADGRDFPRLLPIPTQ